MARLRKDSDCTCPKCGSADHAEVIDWDWGDEYLVRKMWCNECCVDWREYYRIEYDGYTHENKEYDKDGREVD